MGTAFLFRRAILDKSAQAFYDGEDSAWREGERPLQRVKIAVKGILFDRDRRRILLVRRSDDDPTGAGTWESAGGCVEPGETPEEALLREIGEETGVSGVTVQRVAYVSLIEPEDPCLLIVYLCQSPTDQVTLSDEHRAYRWADPAACRALLPRPILDDFNKNGIFGCFRGGAEETTEAL